MPRTAKPEDLDTLAALAASKRVQYAQWQPVFHRPAEGAEASHRAFLADSLKKPGCLLLVEEAAGTVQAWIFARLVDAPPVYAPGGRIVLVDDFCVASDKLWESAGRDLLNEAWAWGKAQGAVLMNVVCGPNDEAKRTLLARLGLEVVSEWHVGSME